MSFHTHPHRAFGIRQLISGHTFDVRSLLLDTIGIVCLILFLSIGYLRFNEIRSASDLSVYRDIGTRAEEVYTGSRDQVDSEYPPMVTGTLWLVNGSVLQGGDFARAWVIFLCVVTVFAWVSLRCFGAKDAALAAAGLFLTTRFLGPELVFGRYDILMTLALFLSWRAHVHRAYAQSAGWLTLAVALKVVPIFAFPLLLIATPRRHWLSLILGTIAAGFITFLLPAAILGMGGALSNIEYMVSYHASRPVQVESLWSGLSFLFSALLFQKDPTGFSHMSFANFSVGDTTILAAKLLVGTGILFLFIRGFFVHRRNDFGLSFILFLTWSIGVSTVFSPQYIVWIVPLIFAVLGERILDGTAGKRTFFLLFLTMAVTALTQWIYPLNYSAVIDQELTGVLMLNLRNALLLVIVYHLLVDAGYVRSIGSQLSTPPLRRFLLPFCIDSCAVAIGIFLLVSAYPHLFPVVERSVWRSGTEGGAASSLQVSRDFPSDRMQLTATVQVPSLAQHRWFAMRVDDCLNGMTVNGRALPASIAFCDGPGLGRTIDLGAFLLTGKNTITVDINNTGGPMGLNLTPRPTPLVLILLIASAAVFLWYGVQCYRMVSALHISLWAYSLNMLYTSAVLWNRFRSSTLRFWMMSAASKRTLST